MHDQSGEHPRNHIGQLLFLRLFLFICGSASFFIHRSTFLTECVPLWTRIVILVLSFAVVIFLFKTVHSAFPEKNDSGQVISKSPFRYLRHPMSLACIVFYIGMSLSTMSLFSFALVLGIFFLLLQQKQPDHIKKHSRKQVKFSQSRDRFCLRLSTPLIFVLSQKMEK